MSNYTIAEAKQVMAETAAILAEDARRKPDIGTARAASRAQPPSANELFFTEVGELMDSEGLSRAEAVRRVSCEKPNLREAYIEELNKEKKQEEDRERETSRRRDRNR